MYYYSLRMPLPAFSAAAVVVEEVMAVETEVDMVEEANKSSFLKRSVFEI